MTKQRSTGRRIRCFAGRAIVFLLLFVGGGTVVNVAVAWTLSASVQRYVPWKPAPPVCRPVKPINFGIDFGSDASVFGELGIRRAGWPCYSFHSRHWDGTVQPGRVPLEPLGIEVGSEYFKEVVVVGFAINTIFYAAILWLLFATPLAIRRWRRIKRGLCPACAYPVGTSPVCTECGKDVGVNKT